MPESSDAILETQASSSLHTTTPGRNLLPRLSLGFSWRESLSAFCGAGPPCLPSLYLAGPAADTWITISIHRCGAVKREEPERCGWRVLELPASAGPAPPRLLKAPCAPPLAPG
jgi:hypothetical protein